ncbi:uncharacterized protein LOC110094545 [Dendrobium catenatum]|uniref:uncharacterized protein LOC110094545 n=1 Tax=Dendrobium catenatum TaxID=906689 RepID=UPI0009F18E3C|nr:uncharacterized protein LOC110094545 [Dendrobium catenatum]
MGGCGYEYQMQGSALDAACREAPVSFSHTNRRRATRSLAHAQEKLLGSTQTHKGSSAPSYVYTGFSISDHSPIILHYNHFQHHKHRFLFKNYWLSKIEFWDVLIDVFSQRFHSSPINAFLQKLKTLKLSIKGKQWVSSNSLFQEISELVNQQNSLLSIIHDSPLDPGLNLALKDTNHSLALKNLDWSGWLLQRAKVNWLTNGEDDLKFLYSRINVRHNSNHIKCITTGDGTFYNPFEISPAIINHFQKLFNTAHPATLSSWETPIHLKLTDDHSHRLISPITVDEIRNVIFSSPNCSAPGPDGYTFEFYKST